jgi:hypothetical protein
MVQGCLFHLDGITHLEINQDHLIVRESDFYDTDHMRSRIFCDPDELAQLPAGQAKQELDAPPPTPLLESPAQVVKQPEPIE